MTNKELKALATRMKIDLNKVPLSEFKRGMAVEKEHSDITKGDPVKTAKIVRAHLKESNQYYKKLAKMEKGFDKKKIAKKCEK